MLCFNRSDPAPCPVFLCRPRQIGSVCSGLQSQVLQCYSDHPQQTLLCSSLARQYMSCVQQAKKVGGGYTLYCAWVWEHQRNCVFLLLKKVNPHVSTNNEFPIIIVLFFLGYHSLLILFKGLLLCKIHFFMYFIHKHVSPLCKEILKVSGKKICSLSVLIHFYKNLSENELIRFWPLYVVKTIFWPIVFFLTKYLAEGRGEWHLIFI